MSHEYEDLAEYLGITREEIDKRVQNMWEPNWKEWAERKSEAAYYQETDFYLFDLTQYQAQEGREAMKARVREAVQRYNGKICCDFGGGIGGDTIAMLEAGAQKVYIVDYKSKTNDYAMWRIKKRGLIDRVRMIYLGEDGLPDETIVALEGRRADLLSSIATLEHCPEPEKSMDWIRNNCDYAVLRPDPSNEEAHPMHHARHFQYWKDLLDSRIGEVVHGMEKIDCMADPPFYRVKERS